MNVGASGYSALSSNVANIQAIAAQRNNSEKAVEATGKSEASVRERIAERGKTERSVKIESLSEAATKTKTSKVSEVNEIAASRIELNQQQKNDAGFSAAAIGQNSNANKQQLGVRLDISV